MDEPKLERLLLIGLVALAVILSMVGLISLETPPSGIVPNCNETNRSVIDTYTNYMHDHYNLSCTVSCNPDSQSNALSGWEALFQYCINVEDLIKGVHP